MASSTLTITTTSTPRILVLGAGELGLSILRALSDHSRPVELSVLLRASSSSICSVSSQLPQVRIIQGDLTLPSAELSTYLVGFDIVINASGFSAGQGSQTRIVQAALRAKVGRYIPWQFGVDYDVIGRGSSQPLFDEQLDVRDVLRAQLDVKWTIISTGLFTSLLFEPTFGLINLDSGIVRALGSWDNRVTVTSPDDIGKLTTSILLDEESAPDGVVYIASDTTTFNGVAQAIERTGKNVQREVISVEELEERLRKDPEDKMARYHLIWARNHGVAWELKDTWNGKRGIRVESLDDYLKTNSSKK
ncbi:saccharopine dehydrogenase-like oxidoreductase [Naematelia encephala]|uniref:Saccharopine dehydrogenase-like oxidoreductase n=1 Tax=Naematelia encephala TaxID=71784 RepID=A0A1Y2BBK1_9TREE|nr:saccharopine dehydrogenase-like oxidoreductase [Naematelia encephala]